MNRIAQDASAADTSPQSIGVLIPEFPGQTHVFFFRELRALKRMGVHAVPISTSRPSQRIAVHVEGRQWAERTRYLLCRRPDHWLAAAVSLAVSFGRVRAWLAEYRDAGAEGGALRAGAILFAAALLHRTCRAEGINHVHVHSCGRSALIAAGANRVFGLSYSLTLHGALEGYGPAQALKWRHARFALVITQRLKDYTRRVLGEALPKDVAIAPMGVDLERWTRARPYEPWGGEGALRLVSCGRLNEGKNHHVTIEAVRRLNASGLPTRLDLIGEENLSLGYRDRLERQVRDAGLEDAVHFHGAVDEAGVRELEERAHIFVLVSQVEELGVAIMEAMAMSLPVVATRVGGVPELVTDGETGVLVEPDDPEPVCAAVRALAADPARAQALGEAACSAVASRFSSNRSAQELVSALERTAPGITLKHAEMRDA